MQPDRILITGGSGFIGTNLLEHLRGLGCELLNIDVAPPLDPAHAPYWRRCDILERERLQDEVRRFAPTLLVHLAARTDLDESQSLEGYAANIAGVENVLAAVRDNPGIRRTIVASSMLVCRLGYAPSCDTDYAPPNLYGESKVLTETITRAFGLQSDWTLIRPTTIWGPWSLRYRDDFFAVLRKGRYLHPGGRKILKTYGYVGNVVHQIAALLKAPAQQVQGRTFYVGDPPIDLKEWVDGFSLKLCGCRARRAPLPLLGAVALAGDVLGRFGVRFPLTSFRLRNMTMDNVLDMTPTLEVTGPGPYTPAQGIDKTVLWLQAHPGGNP